MGVLSLHINEAFHGAIDYALKSISMRAHRPFLSNSARLSTKLNLPCIERQPAITTLLQLLLRILNSLMSLALKS